VAEKTFTPLKTIRALSLDVPARPHPGAMTLKSIARRIFQCQTRDHANMDGASEFSVRHGSAG
jgi:hypothetical protein